MGAARRRGRIPPAPQALRCARNRPCLAVTAPPPLVTHHLMPPWKPGPARVTCALHFPSPSCRLVCFRRLTMATGTNRAPIHGRAGRPGAAGQARAGATGRLAGQLGSSPARALVGACMGKNSTAAMTTSSHPSTHARRLGTRRRRRRPGGIAAGRAQGRRGGKGGAHMGQATRMGREHMLGGECPRSARRSRHGEEADKCNVRATTAPHDAHSRDHFGAR